MSWSAANGCGPPEPGDADLSTGWWCWRWPAPAASATTAGTAYLILPMLSAVGVGVGRPGALWLYRMTDGRWPGLYPKMLAVCSVWAVVVVGYGATCAHQVRW